MCGQKGGRPLFRGSKVMQLNSDSFCDYVRIWMAVIGHLWAELGFWFFPEKGLKYLRPQTFDGREHSGRSCRYNTPVQYGRDAAHIMLSGSESRFHLRTAWRRGNTIWERALQLDWEGVRSWRFCRAQIVRAWTPTFAAANIFYRPQRFPQWGSGLSDLATAHLIDAVGYHLVPMY